MSEMKPNHICKNPECRKHYYACNYCDKSNNWRSVACSFKCYQKYIDLVITERSKGKKVTTTPERTDMTEKEVKELLNKPTEVVLKETKEQLKDYVDVNNSINFAKTIDEINENFNKNKTTTTRSRKKKAVENE